MDAFYWIMMILLVIINAVSVYLIFHYRNSTKALRVPAQEEVHKKMAEKTVDTKPSSSTQHFIPKTVYMTYDDLDGIPDSVIENIKKYCKGYNVEIYGDRKCEDFLYEYYGADTMQLFRELSGEQRAMFWSYCILYVKGGYHFDIKTDFKEHIDKIIKADKPKTGYQIYCHDSNIAATASPSKNPFIWKGISRFFHKKQQVTQDTDWSFISTNYEAGRYLEFPQRFSSAVEELIYRHRHLPDVDKSKLDIPILYINMDKHNSRRKFMEEQLEGLDVTRIPGVLVTDSNHPSLPEHSITKGELGCALAHKNAWQTFLNNDKWDRVLILEDDASLKLTARWGEPLSQVQVPVFLGQGATGYVLDRKTAELLLLRFNTQISIDIGVDSWMWNILGMDETSPENLGYSKHVDRKCHTYYHIYAYNAEEETPTAITDRRYGTNVREVYSKKALKLIRKHRRIGLLIISPKGEVSQTLTKPYIAFFGSHSLVKLLIDSYDDRFNIEVYTGDKMDVLPLRDNVKVFKLPHNNFVEQNFDKIIALGGTHNIIDDSRAVSFIFDDAKISDYEYVIDSYGFPTTVPMVKEVKTKANLREDTNVVKWVERLSKITETNREYISQDILLMILLLQGNKTTSNVFSVTSSLSDIGDSFRPSLSCTACSSLHCLESKLPPLIERPQAFRGVLSLRSKAWLAL